MTDDTMVVSMADGLFVGLSRRERLPNRRHQINDSIRWPVEGGRRIHIGAGLSDDGRILEVFLAGGGKSGTTDVSFLLEDHRHLPQDAA